LIYKLKKLRGAERAKEKIDNFCKRLEQKEKALTIQEIISKLSLDNDSMRVITKTKERRNSIFFTLQSHIDKYSIFADIIGIFIFYNKFSDRRNIQNKPLKIPFDLFRNC